MKSRLLLVVASVLALPLVSSPAAPVAASAEWMTQAQTGGLQLKSVSALAFGDSGVLLVAEPSTASIIAIQTGDVGPFAKLAAKVPDFGRVVADGLGVAADQITVRDLAVNPASGRIYVAVSRKPDNAPVIVTVDAQGAVSMMNTDRMPWARVTLPGGSGSKVTTITDVAFAGDRILAAGSCNEEFASRVFSILLPLENGATASAFSAETYHVSHRKWETRAPISSFVPFTEDGRRYVVGAFACTPIAKFRVDDLQSGAQVKGVSMVELGSGNRPLDLFTYQKGGKDWLVVHTQRFHKPLFGASAYWGARVDMGYLKGETPEKTNENAVRRNVKESKGPDGIEIVDALFGAVQVDKLGDAEAVALMDREGRLSLEVIALP